jgi:hypothetical protein
MARCWMPHGAPRPSAEEILAPAMLSRVLSPFPRGSSQPARLSHHDRSYPRETCAFVARAEPRAAPQDVSVISR